MHMCSMNCQKMEGCSNLAGQGIFFKKHLLGQVFCGSHSGLCASGLCFVVINSSLVNMEGSLAETQMARVGDSWVWSEFCRLHSG